MLSAEGDAAVRILEHRWFASMTAVRELEGQCERLSDALQLAEEAWRCARDQLERLEALRDALGKELAEREELRRAVASDRPEREESSAA